MTNSGVLSLISCIAWLSTSASTFSAPVSFRKDLAPILADKCLACHQENKDKGGYRVDTFDALLQPGDSEEKPIEAGKPDTGLFFHRLVTPDEDERMPQKDDPLPKEQIELFRRWIAEGAKFDGDDPKQALSSLLPAAPAVTAPEKYPQPLPITALLWLPGQNSLLVSGYHEVTQWDTSNGTLIKRFGGLPERLFDLALHPDGKTLAVAGGVPGRSGSVVILDLSNGKIIKTLPPSSDTELAVAFSLDGQWLAHSGAGSNAIRLIRTKDWTQAWRIESHADWVTQLTFSADSQRLASASRDRTARAYKTANGEVLVTQTTHGNPVNAVVISADNQRLFSAANNGEVRVCQIKEDGGGDIGTSVITGRRVEATRLALADKHLLLSSVDGRLRGFDITKKKDDKPLEFPAVDSRIDALALHPGQQQIAVGSANGKVHVIDLAEKKLIRSFTASPGWSDQPRGIQIRTSTAPKAE